MHTNMHSHRQQNMRDCVRSCVGSHCLSVLIVNYSKRQHLGRTPWVLKFIVSKTFLNTILVCVAWHVALTSCNDDMHRKYNLDELLLNEPSSGWLFVCRDSERIKQLRCAFFEFQTKSPHPHAIKLRIQVSSTIKMHAVKKRFWCGGPSGRVLGRILFRISCHPTSRPVRRPWNTSSALTKRLRKL
jgi:hypothetical protein